MIIDRIENSGLYGFCGRLRRALDYLAENDFREFENGRHGVEGERIYAMVSRYRTKNREGSVWEAHRKYIDIQYCAAGMELLGYSPLELLEAREDYSPDKDCLLLDGEGSFVKMGEGTFAVLFPHEAHMPGVSAAGAGTVEKVVMKVLA